MTSGMAMKSNKTTGLMTVSVKTMLQVMTITMTVTTMVVRG